jgi:hypothetical protein
VSFIKRAREAAEAAAEGAQHVAQAGRTKAAEAATTAGRAASDPATHERIGRQAKEALGAARKGVSTVIERIDARTLADLVIKATALQEKTNAALRDKHSPYRIDEISISASIPPGVSFTIGRSGSDDGQGGTAVDSTDLIRTQADAGEEVMALDGTIGDGPTDEPSVSG